MASIADIQDKIIAKMEQKFKTGGMGKVSKAFTDADSNNDGFLTLNEFNKALELCGNALKPVEAEFLFNFWDTLAGQHEAQGVVEVEMCLKDLFGSQKSYGTGFNSGDEFIKASKGAKGNMPSQAGGIFGGGSYEADARGGPVPTGRVPQPPAQVPSQRTEQSNRPRGNQSSIAGGIFGEGPAAMPIKPGGNRGNQSSIPGGIFG